MKSDKGLLIIISGFSGAGKGTIVNKLISDFDDYALSISMTTRQPRNGETDGKEYFFVTRDAFENRIAADGLIEYAQYCDNYYGTPRDYVESQLDAGRNVILEIEMQGSLKVKEKFPEALLIFVTPPSAKELEARLRGRGTESEEQIQKRLSAAAGETKYMEKYDYIVINDNLDECVQRIHNLIDYARMTPIRSAELIEEMKDQLNKLTKGE